MANWGPPLPSKADWLQLLFDSFNFNVISNLHESVIVQGKSNAIIYSRFTSCSHFATFTFLLYNLPLSFFLPEPFESDLQACSLFTPDCFCAYVLKDRHSYSVVINIRRLN